MDLPQCLLVAAGVTSCVMITLVIHELERELEQTLDILKKLDLEREISRRKDQLRWLKYINDIEPSIKRAYYGS